MTVGTTRTSGGAGPVLNLNAFLEGDLTEMQVPVLLNNINWSYGTGANAVNVIFADTITVGNGATVNIDLNASGTYLDIFTRALTLEAVKFIYIKNNSADATLELLGAGATALGICKVNTDIIEVKPGGTFTWSDPSAAGLDCEPTVNFRLVHDSIGADTMDVDVIIMGLD